MAESMHGLALSALISVVLGTISFGADPVAHFMLLQTDLKTAGFVEKATQDDSLTAEQFSERIGALVAGRKLTELASFKKPFGQIGLTLKFDKDSDKIEVADGELMPTGMFLEAEAHIGPAGLVDVVFKFDRAIKAARNQIETERTLSAATVQSDRWEVLCDWGDNKSSVLLLVNFSNVPEKENRALRPLHEVHFDSEIRWCEPFDLKKFELSTPETRPKAIEWLKSRGELIATSGVRMRSGEKAVQQNVLQWIHNDEGWTTTDLGWMLEYECKAHPQDNRIDVRLLSEWHPRDAKRPPLKSQFVFQIVETTDSGSTLVVPTSARPEQGPIPVIFITPTIRVIAGTGELKKDQ